MDRPISAASTCFLVSKLHLHPFRMGAGEGGEHPRHAILSGLDNKLSGCVFAAASTCELFSSFSQSKADFSILIYADCLLRPLPASSSISPRIGLGWAGDCRRL